MKKLILALSLMAFLSFSYAQTERNKPVKCYKTKAVLEILVEQLEEKPIFMGRVDDTKSPISVIVLYNATKDTYSILEFNSTTACMISSGDTVEISLPAGIVTK